MAKNKSGQLSVQEILNRIFDTATEAIDAGSQALNDVWNSASHYLGVNMATALSKNTDSITSRPEGTTYTNITASTNAIRTGAAILVGMYVNSTSSGTIKIYDSLTQANTVVNNTITPAIGWHNLGNATLGTGLSVTIGGTLDVTLYYIATP